MRFDVNALKSGQKNKGKTHNSVVIAISKVRTPRINYLFQMKAFHLCQLSIQIQRFTFVVLAEIGS